MAFRSVSAYAPATVANVGAGFDVFGFALQDPGDLVEVHRTDADHVHLREVLGTRGLSMDTDKNVASAVVKKMWEDVRPGFGVDVVLRKRLPLGSGMGSSAASAVAAAVAADRLFGGPFTREALLEYCRYGEKVACGTPHADNVAPSLYGGFVIVRQGEPPDVVNVPAARWYVTVVQPHVRIETREARKALPRTVRLADAARMAGNAAAAVVAVQNGDIALFGRAVEDDPIVQPRRLASIPYGDEVIAAGQAEGAAAAGVSGSGPSLFAVCAGGQQDARNIGQKMRAAWVRRGVNAQVYVSIFACIGARVITEEPL